MGYNLKGVSFNYSKENLSILNDFEWTIAPRERWAIVGPSGCGKTTLLYLLAGLKKPTSGTVTYQEAPVVAPMPYVSFIQQHYGLFRWKTVGQNMALPLLLQGLKKEVIKEKVAQQLLQLGLADFADKYPAELSGGQCQRVAIGRALINHPEVLLMDEPFSALDALTREQLQVELRQLSLAEQVTLVLVTHSIEEAVYMCENVLVFPALGKNPIYIDNHSISKNRYAADFVEQCARIRACLEKERHHEA